MRFGRSDSIQSGDNSFVSRYIAASSKVQTHDICSARVQTVWSFLERLSFMLRSAMISTSLLFVVAQTSAPMVGADDNVATGVVFVDANNNRSLDVCETGLAGVSVSNGKDVVETDSSGRYKLAPEVVPVADAAAQEIRANVFNAFPDAVVEWRLNDDEWQPMQKTVNETDSIFQALFGDEKPLLPNNLLWRKLGKPMVCPHLWKATLTSATEKGTHLIQVRATNSNGQVLNGERIMRVE